MQLAEYLAATLRESQQTLAAVLERQEAPAPVPVPAPAPPLIPAEESEFMADWRYIRAIVNVIGEQAFSLRERTPDHPYPSFGNAESIQKYP